MADRAVERVRISDRRLDDDGNEGETREHERSA